MSGASTDGDARMLEIDSLTKNYGELVALSDMTFNVQAGEIFGFVGGNGAGKTTTMRIALGVLSAASGVVRWAGRPVDLQTWRRIGYMPEERGLYPRMRVGDQLAYFAELHGLAATDAKVAVARWTARLGVDKVLDKELQKLSLGNQQRVQLAAALVHGPDVLILDEPFSGLDPIAVDVMSEVLREQSDAGVPVLFSSHQLDLVQRLCDRVGIVNAGKMVACGTVDELRSGGETELIVDVPNAPLGWSKGLPGFELRSIEGPRHVFVAAPGADEQSVLQAAMLTGPVKEFGLRRQSLNELFRAVIAEQQDKFAARQEAQK